HSIALKSDGTVVTWGEDSDDLNVIPPSVTNVQAVAAGIFHNVVLKNDGIVVTWGGAPYGSITVPEGLSNVVAISAGWDHTIALQGDGTVVYWGGVQKTIQSNIVAIAAGTVDLLLTSNGNVLEWDGDNLSLLEYSNVVKISSAAGEFNVLIL